MAIDMDNAELIAKLTEIVTKQQTAIKELETLAVSNAQIVTTLTERLLSSEHDIANMLHLITILEGKSGNDRD